MTEYIRGENDTLWHISSDRPSVPLCDEEIGGFIYTSSTPGWGLDMADEPVCEKCKRIHAESARESV